MKSAALPLTILLLLTGPAFAIHPKEMADAGREGPSADASASPDRVKLQEQWQREYAEVRAERRQEFLKAAGEMAGPFQSTIPGWTEKAVRPGAARAGSGEPAEPKDASWAGFGRLLLLFAGTTGLVVLILFGRNRLRPAGRATAPVTTRQPVRACPKVLPTARQ